MIKSLFDTDEEPTPKTPQQQQEEKPSAPPPEKTAADSVSETAEKQENAPVAEDVNPFDSIEDPRDDADIQEYNLKMSENNFEIPGNAQFFTKKSDDQAIEQPEIERPQIISDEALETETPTVEMSVKKFSNAENQSSATAEENSPETNAANDFVNEFYSEQPANTENKTAAPPIDAAASDSAASSAAPNNADEPTIFQSAYTPETAGETVRNSGLAYSAAIVLFGAVVFMMVLGWFLGQLVGNPTAGIVGGIILGAIIGFIQFFRITSSIFKK